MGLSKVFYIFSRSAPFGDQNRDDLVTMGRDWHENNRQLKLAKKESLLLSNCQHYYCTVNILSLQ